jgi:class 3 adenylate cyclase
VIGPSRTLTFLFADLRDYTPFVESRGDATARELIAEYRRLVRAAVERTSGAEIKTEGDNFYVVFETAGKALDCSMAILRAAERHTRERPDLPLRVGVGLHAGEPVPHEGQYVGSAVNIAARLASAAGPGELLVSELVRGLVRTSGQRPMQERTGVALKGISDAPRVFVVDWHEAQHAASSASAPAASTSRAPEAAALPVAPTPGSDRRILFRQLVGREDELARVDQLWADALAGHGRAMLISGEAGVGKSAVVRAVVDRLADAHVYRAECVEVEARLPFGPLVEILRSILHDLSDAPDHDPRSRVSALLELFRRRGDLVAERPEEEDRYRAHTAIARVLSELSERWPIAVVIEDVHWADEATLELIPYLARKVAGQRMLYLLSYRSDELHRRHPLRHVLAELGRSRGAEEIVLRPLTREQLGQAMAEGLALGRQPTKEFLSAIHERSEGNPLVAEEILRSLVERGDLALSDGSWLRTRPVAEIEIPETLRDAIGQRYRALDERTQNVLRHLAVIGQRAGFDLIAAVTGLDERTLVGSLRAAVDAQILVEEAGVQGDEAYAFRHALVRESVLAELLQRERRLLHLTVGEAIERLAAADGTPRAEELAYHFDQARETERAVTYHELAARDALRALAYLRARAHLERALELAAADDPRLPSLHRRLASVADVLRDPPVALRAAREAHRLFLARGDVLGAAEALAYCARVEWLAGEADRAERDAAEAVRLAEVHPHSRELGLAYAESARVAMLDARLSDAVRWGERALVVARALNDRAIEADALATIGFEPAFVQGDLDRAVSIFRRARELTLGEHDLFWVTHRAYFNLWVLLHNVGTTDAAAQVHRELQAWADREGLPFAPVISALNAFAEPDWSRLEELALSTGWGVFESQTRMLFAMARAARDGPAAGWPVFEEGGSSIGTVRGYNRFVADALRVKFHVLIGEPARALEKARELTSPLPYWHAWVAGCALWAAVDLDDGKALSEWLAIVDEFGDRPGHGMAGARALAEGIRLGQRSDHLSAADRFVAGAADYDGFLDPVQSTCARLLAVDAFLAAGASERAAAVFHEARSFWDRAGATWYLDQLDGWAARQGIGRSS